MGLKIYEALCNTTLNGKFVWKGTKLSLSEAPQNVNFKLVDEDGAKVEKTATTTKK